MNDTLLTLIEVAQRYRVTPQTIRRWAKDGTGGLKPLRLSDKRVSRGIWFRLSDLVKSEKRLMEESMKKPRKPPVG